MAQTQIIAVLDIGSSKIRSLVSLVEPKKNTCNIIGVGVSPSSGIRKGAISEMDEAISNITNSLEEAERMSGESIHRVYVTFSGPNIETYDSRGVIAISGNGSEITDEDVDRVLAAAKAVSLPANREILRIIPRSFTVDSQHNIKYPVGMNGIRLEVEAHIVAGQTSVIKNLEKALYQTGIDTQELLPSHIVAAEAVLNRQQKELGVVLVEIGSCSTNISVFEESNIIHSAILPVGGEHVTNDIAIGARVAIETAEKLKIEYGTALSAEVKEMQNIDLSQISKMENHSISEKQLSKIIEARYQEIFLMIRDELQKIGRVGMLPAGIVLCGGAVKMAGISELARETLGLPVQIGFPRDIEGGMVDRVDDPSFASAVGLLHFAHKYGQPNSFVNFSINKIFSSLGQMFRKLF